MRIYYNSKLTPLARALKKNSTMSEIILWKYLKNDKMLGYDFHRQKPIGEFIVDFFCNRLKLVIEINGGSHKDKYAYDSQRQQYLENLGLHVIWFDDKEVKKDIDNVLRVLQIWIEENKPYP